MRLKRLWLAVVAGVIGVIVVASVALATSTLDDGDYTLTLPGVGDFEFTIDSDATGDTVIAVAAPLDYAIDDDDPDKAAWKKAASLEVEVKLDKIEADYDWSNDAELALPGGGSITVEYDVATMTMNVTADGGWWAFGSGSDWYVANTEFVDDFDDDTKFFKVEANENGVELKPVEDVDDGFLNDLEDDDEAEELEVEEVEVEDEGSGKPDNPGKP